jgi:hypothetical protein
MRLFYLAWPPEQISQTPSAKLAAPMISETVSGESTFSSISAISATASRNSGAPKALSPAFPLPWSAYVRLLWVKDPSARSPSEAEILKFRG